MKKSRNLKIAAALTAAAMLAASTTATAGCKCSPKPLKPQTKIIEPTNSWSTYTAEVTNGDAKN